MSLKHGCDTVGESVSVRVNGVRGHEREGGKGVRDEVSVEEGLEFAPVRCSVVAAEGGVRDGGL